MEIQMQVSVRPARIQSRKPRLSETQGASTLFAGKTDFEVGQERRRKDHKPKRHPRTEWEYPHHKTNIGAEKGRYMGEEL
ncbi:hypothetical protein X917_gp11 [Pseudomonas phage PPpW-4]|uniref:Uncharacterized protein n=1 Tax=Pseudomonas phage PPpW-4 TaxID=1279083 RepID=V5YTG7_9CAUD|nr:hypothetical protein X917_gp11 [Pseudomonas phage PPpW-4]BAO20677.1 hypothetical protein [Pseudomonas phage PPpW-4]